MTSLASTITSSYGHGSNSRDGKIDSQSNHSSGSGSSQRMVSYQRQRWFWMGIFSIPSINFSMKDKSDIQKAAEDKVWVRDFCEKMKNVENLTITLLEHQFDRILMDRDDENHPACNEDGSDPIIEGNTVWLKETRCYDACGCGGCWKAWVDYPIDGKRFYWKHEKETQKK